MDVLRLYNLLMDGISLDEITTEFENNPEIIIQLLQFVSSGALDFFYSSYFNISRQE